MKTPRRETTSRRTHASSRGARILSGATAKQTATDSRRAMRSGRNYYRRGLPIRASRAGVRRPAERDNSTTKSEYSKADRGRKEIGGGSAAPVRDTIALLARMPEVLAGFGLPLRRRPSPRSKSGDLSQFSIRARSTAEGRSSSDRPPGLPARAHTVPRPKSPSGPTSLPRTPCASPAVRSSPDWL